MPKERSLVLVLIFSLFTFGIYYYYWLYITMRDINQYLEDRQLDEGVELLIAIIFPPYQWFWFYKYGQRLEDVGIKAMVAEKDDSVIYLVLSILGLSIIGQGMMQYQLNLCWESVYENM